MGAARARRLPEALAVLTVLLQIGYPLTSGRTRDLLTIATVLAFCAASATHAVVHRGARWAAAYLAVTTTTGLLVEAVGTRTGVPFGDYAYADTLGPRLLQVPLVVPMAWAMMAYPCLLVGRRLARSGAGAALLGGTALAGWDLFLDPQMVAAGHWTWSGVRTSLPGAPGIPVSNTLGWLLVGVLMVGALHLLPAPARGPRQPPPDDRQPYALFLWTYASSVLAFAVFFGRPLTALVGGVGMGLVAVPFAVRLARSRRPAPAAAAPGRPSPGS